VAEVVSGLAIARFLAAAQAPEVPVHSQAVVPAGAQLAPAALAVPQAWVAAEEVAEAAAGADKSRTQFIGKIRSDL